MGVSEGLSPRSGRYYFRPATIRSATEDANGDDIAILNFATYPDAVAFLRCVLVLREIFDYTISRPHRIDFEGREMV